MPKIGRMSDEQRELAAQIREQFGGALVLTQSQIGKVMGFRSKDTTRRWLATLTPRIYGGDAKKRWLVQDVAKKMLEGMNA
jgi:hypothetical protein